VTLLLDNADVRSVLRMRDAIDALDAAFVDYAEGVAVNRPRSHTYTHRGGARHYLFKTMDGSVPRLGVHALRLSSDLTDETGGKRIKIPAAPGDRYVGLVLLFDLETLAPVAILHDGYLQRVRVGATSALAAARLARKSSRVVGMIGAGWQAGPQIEGLREVLDVEEVRVYAPTREKLDAFAVEHDATPVGSAREAIEGADVVVLATNSQQPVLDGAWLTPGTHVNSVQRHELDATTLSRAELIVVRSREEPTFHFAPGHAPRAARDRQLEDVVELGDVLKGLVGRTRDDQITLFTGGGGLGIQFAAVAHAVYAAAREVGAGRDLPTEWFTQEEKP
jgi:ornithine cyclodeaminase/alanine dehydrogenase-like protein (mu-crystallin family)